MASSNPFADRVRALLRARIEAAARDPNLAAETPPPESIRVERDGPVLRLGVQAQPGLANRTPLRLTLAFLAVVAVLTPLAIAWEVGLGLGMPLIAVPWLGFLASSAWLLQTRWRRLVLEVSPDSLKIIDRMPLWSDDVAFRRDELTGIHVGLSALSRDDAPIFELKVAYGGQGALASRQGGWGSTHVLLEGWPKDDLEWIAATLRRTLDVPTGQIEPF